MDNMVFLRHLNILFVYCRYSREQENKSVLCFQLIVTLYLLYKQIGLSFVAGVAFSIVLIPINKIIANKIGKLSTKLMEYKDKRVRLVGETLRGITTIKANVWEGHFLRSIFS